MKRVGLAAAAFAAVAVAAPGTATAANDPFTACPGQFVREQAQDRQRDDVVHLVQSLPGIASFGEAQSTFNKNRCGHGN